MRRVLSAVLATTLLVSMLMPLGGCGVLEKVGIGKKTTAFTTEYETNESNVGFFVDNDEFESLLTASPFYGGAQQLPTPGLREFETARAKKVVEIIAAGDALYAASLKAKPSLIDLRSSYVDFLDAAYKLDRVKLKKFKKGSLENLSMLAFKESLAEQEYATFKESGPTGTKNADALMRYLQVSKAVELAGYQLKEANDLAVYSAMAVSALKDHKNAKVKKLAADYDAKMSAFDQLLGELDPVASGIQTVDGGLKQLASADYYMAREASNWMAAELPKVEEAVNGAQPKEGVSAEDIEFYKASVAAYRDTHKALAERLASVDTSRLVAADDLPHPGLGVVGTAYAAEVGYTPNQDANAAGQVLATPAPTEEGLLKTGWSGVKRAFAAAQTGAGVAVDVLGAGVYNVSSVAVGVWSGSSMEDIGDDIMDNTQSIINDYNAGRVGSSTLRTAGAYMDEAEKGVSWVAAEGTKAVINKPYQWLGGTGETGIGEDAAWVTGGLTKIIAGMFTGLSKGIYKVVDTRSNAKDIAGGAVDIGLSFIGGSKVLIKGSTVLKGARESAPSMGRLGLNYLSTWRNGLKAEALTAETVKLLKDRKLAGEAASLITNGIAVDVRAGVAAVLAENRKLLITKIKDAASRALTTDAGNWKETVRSSLQDLFVKSFANSRAGWLEVMSTVIGGSAVDIFDNLAASQLDPIISGLIAEALAGAPEPAQMNGQWNGAQVITDVPDTPAETEAAKEGCDFTVNWAKLKGQKIPVRWVISMDESGSGTVLSKSGTSSLSGKIKYADGDVTISLRQGKVTMTLTGTASFADAGGITMSGEWTLPLGPGGGLGGTWSASK